MSVRQQATWRGKCFKAWHKTMARRLAETLLMGGDGDINEMNYVERHGTYMGKYMIKNMVSYKVRIWQSRKYVYL